MKIDHFRIRNNYKVSFSAALSREEWTPYLEKVSAQLQKKDPVDGFRKGKAPIALAAKKYGTALYNPAAKEAADDCIRAACSERKLSPVSLPAVSILRADTEEFVCLVELENYPDVENLEYKGLQAEMPVHKCTEAEIDAEIEKFIDQRLYVHEVAREAQMGDIAEVDFTGTHNGGPFPYDHSSKSRFVLGSGQLFAGLDEALCGHVAGDRLELTLTMPEDFHRKDVADLTLELRVNLHGVWARDRRTLDDAFVQEFVEGADTVAEYREKTRAELQRRLDERSERLFQANLNQALAKALPIELPPAMVATTARRYLETLAELASREGLTAEQYLAREGKTLEDYRRMVEPAAREQTAVSIAVDSVIGAEQLTVDPERVDGDYRRYAQSYGISAEEAARRIDREALVEEYLHRDAMKLIRAAAVPIPVEVDELPPEL